MTAGLQWGGRFAGAPDEALLRFGSSMDEDLLLAPFDVQCSLAHVTALQGGGIISADAAKALRAALGTVAGEISDGSFRPFAFGSGAEDVHGAIDARVRELETEAGELLHAGRSRNDQVATTLLLYCADRAQAGGGIALAIADQLLSTAEAELEAGTLVAGTTHWQPAQPVLLAFWLCAAAQPFVRSTRMFREAFRDAKESCPLGSAALAGSSLPLDRDGAAAELGFNGPSINAMDAIGNRDAALNLTHACVRSSIGASRLCEELIVWAAPAFGYARIGDAASTGSSLMPQKRNPDPFELIRGTAADLCGRYAGALAVISGLGLSYHRDLQIAKKSVLQIVETSLCALNALKNALPHVTFVREAMNARAETDYTVATDVADALIAGGMSARKAHAHVGAAIQAHEAGKGELELARCRSVRPGKAHGRFDEPFRGRAMHRRTARAACEPAAVTRIHVFGASGYAGSEIVRLVEAHPQFVLGAIESGTHAGEPIGAQFPRLGSLHRAFDPPGTIAGELLPGDAVVLAGHAGAACDLAPALLARDAKVVDLSADFRLAPSPAVYGYAERYRDAIAEAQLVANPGCYPTATLLSTLPLAPFAPAQIIVDAKSGITGAGRTPLVSSLFAEVAGEVRAYGLEGHRHEREILQEWRAAGMNAALTFTPHVVPIDRGMLVDAYAVFERFIDAESVHAAYTRAYACSFGVRLLDSTRAPSLAAVRGTHDAELHVSVQGNVVRAICAIDNLGRGAATQALANLNLMYGYPEGVGLDARAFV